MEVAYLYSKSRSEFGKPCKFANGETTVLHSILPTKDYDKDYIDKKSCEVCISTIPSMSESYVNTENVATKNSSIFHTEGGWPKDVDMTEQTDLARFRKKAEKDESYLSAVRKLAPIAERCMKQNYTTDLYEQYFEKDNLFDHCSEPPSAKGLAVFRDPSNVKRSTASIDWHPEISSSKIAVSYSIMKFQDERLNSPNLPTSSYIWDITNSNKPCIELTPQSPLCCLRFNPKSTDILVGGCYNGLITCFDLRKPDATTGSCAPTETSIAETSHHDPVSDVHWISSKTGHQCVSVSTDGKMMWWDTRKLNEPLDSLILYNDTNHGGVNVGGCSLEYNSEAGPTKYLVGTELGTVVSVNLRNRKVNNGVSISDDALGKKHLGPIYCIRRNPIHNKFFMTIGDWTAKIWNEDLKSPIISTRYHESYLTGGCWSPVRAGVFYTIDAIGSLNVWDFNHRQNESVLTYNVGRVPLTSISAQGNPQVMSNLLAVGDEDGTVSLLELCKSLSISQKDEKANILNTFERETRKERNLEARERELKRSVTSQNQDVIVENEDDTEGDAIIQDIEERFRKLLANETDEKSEEPSNMMNFNKD